MGIEGLLVGRVLGGRYRIEEVIGRGGMGAVYRATDERLGREVALKVITVAGTADAETRERLRARFFREARSAAAIPHHPNVVPVYDYGSDEALGLDFLVMELLRGADLASRLATGGIPPLSLSLRILLEAARGLSVGHRMGLIHRDVKPGNIFLARDANDEIQVRVVDFGIAKLADDDTLAQLTQDGRAPHSPAFASPEQLRGLANLTPAADVFSLGAVGYQLVTGERPFNESDRNRMSLGMSVSPPPIRDRNPALPGSVEAVILRALEFEPEKRYPNAGAMAVELEQAIRSLADEPLEPYLSGIAGATAILSDEDDRTLLDDLREEDRTLLQDTGGEEPTLVAPDPGSVHPEAGVLERPAIADRIAREAAAERPRPRQPLPPRPPVQTRRGVGGILVWGFVLLVLLAASLWGWNEFQRASNAALRQQPDSLDIELVEDSLPEPTAAERAAEADREGRLLFNEGRYDDALFYFRQAADLEPEVYDYRRNYGLTLLRIGRLDTAARELERAIDLDPAQPLAYFDLGQVRIEQGDTVEAIRRYREYVDRETNPARRQLANRYVQTWEAALNPVVDLIGEPIEAPLPDEPLPIPDTLSPPPPSDQP